MLNDFGYVDKAFANIREVLTSKREYQRAAA